jgi:GT2 family glycosyltransferase
MAENLGSTTSVIVVTYNRPDYVRTCLEHLSRQKLPATEIVVVDSSPHRLTEAVVAQFPHVRYLRNELGRGHMATSRAIGVAETTSEIVAFIDDDAYAEPDWLEQLVAVYDDDRIGAVGGRADNGRPEELTEGLDAIGLLLPNGALTGNFASDPGAVIDVEHLLGANMSYRRSALAAIGGIHDHWPGTSLREDSDTGLRMVRAGYRVLYQPKAVVFHVGGTYAVGRRFDLRYTFYGARNHVVLLHHALGRHDLRTRRYLQTAMGEVLAQLRYGVGSLGDPERSAYRKVRGLANGFTRAGALLGGTVVGIAAARRVEASTAHAPHKPQPAGASAVTKHHGRG